jgi:signal peptidase I
LRRRVARFIERTLAVTGALFILYHGFFEVSPIATSSMAPLLVGRDRVADPDWILVERCFTARRAPPRRFELVSFLSEEGDLVSKRVVGFPGETVQVLRDRTLVIDGHSVAAPAGVGGGRGYLPCGNLRDGRPFVVPAGEVYVLGDDTDDSYDSRFTRGLPIERIRGRVLARILPLARLELLP